MTKPLVQNAADESQVKGAQSKSKFVRDQELNDMREVLASRAGRRFVWRYLSACGVFRTSFNHSGSVTAFNEGERNIGLKLLADVNEAAPEAYLTMMKESKGTENV